MRDLIHRLREKGIEFADGLSVGELEESQKRYNVRFPPDLAEFLFIALPISKNFPNWRTGFTETSAGANSIEQILHWPADGILFDVRHDEFWLASWGDRPASISEALVEASRRIALAPPLIPVWGHRFLPSEPLSAGNPVLSVMQTDIIYFGDDLASYFSREFGIEFPLKTNGQHAPRRIRFWSDVIEAEDDRFRFGMTREP